MLEKEQFYISLPNITGEKPTVMLYTYIKLIAIQCTNDFLILQQ